VFADHPQIQLIDRLARGSLQNHRIEKIRAGFEHPHRAAPVAMVASKAGGDGGFSLARSRGGKQ